MMRLHQRISISIILLFLSLDIGFDLGIGLVFIFTIVVLELRKSLSGRLSLLAGTGGLLAAGLALLAAFSGRARLAGVGCGRFS